MTDRNNVDSMDERSVKTVRVRRRDRSAPAFVLLVVAGVGLALVKPWQGQDRSGSVDPVLASAIPAAVAEHTPLPAPSLSPAEVAAMAARGRRQCQSGIGWRVVTMEETGGRPTRTLLLVAPSALPATPADASIPTAVLYAQRLFGIGFCQPSLDGGTDAGPLPQVAIWSVPGSGPPVRVVQPISLDAGLAAIGESYFGPPIASATNQWAPGRYVFEVRTDTGNLPSASPAWFALDYRDPRTAAAGDPPAAAP